MRSHPLRGRVLLREHADRKMGPRLNDEGIQFFPVSRAISGPRPGPLRGRCEVAAGFLAAAWAPQRRRGRWRYAAARLASFAIVARLQPVMSCIAFQDLPSASMVMMPALRRVSSGRPL